MADLLYAVPMSFILVIHMIGLAVVIRYRRSYRKPRQWPIHVAARLFLLVYLFVPLAYSFRYSWHGLIIGLIASVIVFDSDMKRALSEQAREQLQIDAERVGDDYRFDAWEEDEELHRKYSAIGLDDD